MRKILSILFILFVPVASFASDNLFELRNKANNGDAEAQYALGEFYTGIHMESDYILALKYLRQSANQGNSKAAQLLKKITSPGKEAWGDFVLNPFYDLGVLDSISTANLLNAIKEGGYDAAVIYANSLFDEGKYTEAVKYYEITLKNLNRDIHPGYIGGEEMFEMNIVFDAVTMLGYCYEHGLGVPKDLYTALAYYEIFGGYGETNDPQICNLIKTILDKYDNAVLNEYAGECGGQMYDALVPSTEGARAWSKCAILYLILGKYSNAFSLILSDERTEPDKHWNTSAGTIFNLWAGESYYKGIGRSQDLNKAFKIFEYIVNSENSSGTDISDYYPDVYADACYRLYECYAFGRGSSPDANKAKKYYQEALRYGSSSALYDDQQRYEIIK
jgi:TPR repeat protein